MKKSPVGLLLFAIREWRSLLIGFITLIPYQTIAQNTPTWDNLKVTTRQRLEKEHAQIRSEMSERGISWDIGLTHLSTLTDDEMRARLNQSDWSQLEDAGIHYFKPNRAISSRELPAHFDWRDHPDGNYITIPKNQGGCGSCWAFAATGVFEAQLGIAARDPLLQPNLAEQILVSCDPNDGCGGGWPQTSFKHFIEKGTQHESCMKYLAKNGSCANACSDYRDKPIRAADRFRVDQNRDSIKQALQLGPLAADFRVYSDFNDYKSGVYRRTSSNELGGHSVVIVGWDDNDRAWIIKNSWGSNWGEDSYGAAGHRGFYRLGWGECGIENIVWGLVVNADCPECADADGDGYYAKGCEHYLCGNRIDCNDNNSQITDTGLWCADHDGDGYAGDKDCSTACDPQAGQLAGGQDCDDNAADVNPATAEICDGKDNNCDGKVDGPDAQDAQNWCADQDSDGYAGSDQCTTACTPGPGQLAGGQDCNDSDASVNPHSPEICDGKDNNCDGRTDDADAQGAQDWCIDRDSDGYGDLNECIRACNEPDDISQVYVLFSLGADCADDNPNSNPSAVEECDDGIDNDCDNAIDRDDEDCNLDVSGVLGCASASSPRSQPSVLFLVLALFIALGRSLGCFNSKNAR